MEVEDSEEKRVDRAFLAPLRRPCVECRCGAVRCGAGPESEARTKEAGNETSRATASETRTNASVRPTPVGSIGCSDIWTKLKGEGRTKSRSETPGAGKNVPSEPTSGKYATNGTSIQPNGIVDTSLLLPPVRVTLREHLSVTPSVNVMAGIKRELQGLFFVSTRVFMKVTQFGFR